MELHSRDGAGWMRLLVRGPGQEAFTLLDSRHLRAFTQGNYRTWLNLCA